MRIVVGAKLEVPLDLRVGRGLRCDRLELLYEPKASKTKRMTMRLAMMTWMVLRRRWMLEKLDLLSEFI